MCGVPIQVELPRGGDELRPGDNLKAQATRLGQRLEPITEIKLFAGEHLRAEPAHLAEEIRTAEDVGTRRPSFEQAHNRPKQDGRTEEEVFLVEPHQAATASTLARLNSLRCSREEFGARKRVRIDKNQPIARGHRRSAISSSRDLIDRLEHNRGTGATRQFSSPVGGVVVANNDFRTPTKLIKSSAGGFDRRERLVDELLFVEGRNNYGDFHLVIREAQSRYAGPPVSEGIVPPKRNPVDHQTMSFAASRLDLHFELFGAFEAVAECREELGDFFEVFEVHHFDRGMHVAVRQADERAGYAPACPENHVRIGAARGGHRFELKLDFLFLGDALEALHNFGMVAAAAGDGGAFAKFDVAMLLLIDSGVIGGVCDIDHQSAIRLQAIGDLARAEQTDFFHDVGDGADFGFDVTFLFAEETQGFSDGECADLIIESPADGEIAAQEFEFVHKRYWVANLHPFLSVRASVHADVDEEILNLRDFALAFLLGEVWRDVADDAAHRSFLGVNGDALGADNGGINPAEATDINEAVFVDEIYRHADVVGVAREHHPWRTAFVQDGHRIAVCVSESFVGEVADIVEPDALAAHFMSGRAGCVDQKFKKLDRFVAHSGADSSHIKAQRHKEKEQPNNRVGLRAANYFFVALIRSLIHSPVMPRSLARL